MFGDLRLSQQEPLDVSRTRSTYNTPIIDKTTIRSISDVRFPTILSNYKARNGKFFFFFVTFLLSVSLSLFLCSYLVSSYSLFLLSTPPPFHPHTLTPPLYHTIETLVIENEQSFWTTGEKSTFKVIFHLTNHEQFIRFVFLCFFLVSFLYRLALSTRLSHSNPNPSLLITPSYKPEVFEVLKFGWVQYLAIAFILHWVVNLLRDFVHRHHLLDTRVLKDSTPPSKLHQF